MKRRAKDKRRRHLRKFYRERKEINRGKWTAEDEAFQTKMQPYNDAAWKAILKVAPEVLDTDEGYAMPGLIACIAQAFGAPPEMIEKAAELV